MSTFSRDVILKRGAAELRDPTLEWSARAVAGYSNAVDTKGCPIFTEELMSTFVGFPRRANSLVRMTTRFLVFCVSAYLDLTERALKQSITAEFAEGSQRAQKKAGRD